MENDKKAININISTITILKILFVLLLLYLVYLLGNIIAILFVSLILASLITPWVDWMARKRIPRALGVILIYIILFAIVSFIIYSMIPPIIEQVNEFSKDSPAYLEKMISNFSVFKEQAEEKGFLNNIKEGLGAFSSDLQSATGGVFSMIGSLFGGIFSFVLTMVITFYMVVEENAMKKVVWSVVPGKHQPYIIQLLGRMQKKVGLWLRGQIILSVIMFIITYLGLLLLGVKYALMLAMLAALAEFVPYLGPILAAIPALIIAFVQSPILAIFVLVFYYLVQLVENHILVPKIMQKFVGLNPIVIIVVLIVGFNIGGIIGGILAIPVATAISVFLKDVFDRRRAEEEDRQMV